MVRMVKGYRHMSEIDPAFRAFAGAGTLDEFED
jgi:hypothetical protein